MIALLTACAVAVAAGVTVTVAPDQPLPHVYADEPLILEIVAEESVTVRARIRVVDDGNTAHERDLGVIRLPGGAARWLAVNGVPTRRGNYRLEVSLADTESDEQWTRSVAYCFVDRRPITPFARVLVDSSGERPGELELAARTVGVGTVRLAFREGLFQDAAPEFLARGLRLVIEAAPEEAAALAEWLAALDRAARDLVIRCELRAENEDDPAAWHEAAATLTQAATAIEVVPVVTTAAQIGSLLASDTPSATIRQIVLGGDASPESLQAAAVSLGIERIPMIGAAQPGSPQDADAVAAWLTDFFRAWGAGVSPLAVDEGHLLSEEGLGHAYPYLAMMAHRLPPYRVMGWLPLDPDGSHALLLRNGADWLLVAWAYEPVQTTMPLGDYETLAALDASGNPIDPGAVVEGALTLALGPMPRLWEGRGGDPLTGVALAQAAEATAAVLAANQSGSVLDQDILDILDDFRRAPGEPLPRRHFFRLLQAFPELETAWHTGREPVEAVIPVLAALSDLMRAICVLEEMHGEEFLEPLSDTLAQCSEYQALFVTGSTAQGRAQARGDWLLRKVDRLTAEARLLADHGRVIEANAVATLAEWRARALGALTAGPSEAR